MSPEEYLSSVEERLRADGAKVTTETIRDEPTLVGYRPAFKLRWFATKLNLFTVAKVEDVITAQKLEHFAEDAVRYAINKKGRFRGLQNGVAAIPVLIGSKVEPDAIAYAQNELIKRFSAFGWPAVVDLSTNQVHSHEGRVVIGGIYASWMRQQLGVALAKPTP